MAEGDRSIDADAPELARLAQLLECVAAQSRLAVLLGLLNGRSMPAVAEELAISRSALQGHLDLLIQRRLVYRPETGDDPYRLTPLGLFFAVFVQQNKALLLDVIDRIAETEAEVEAELADLPVSDETLERMVAEEMYDRVGDEMADMLRNLVVEVPDQDGNDSADGNVAE